MFTVVETPTFRRLADEIWDEEERMDFVTWIAANAEAGDVIKGAGGLRKVRWTCSGMGKRGGARVIYFVRNDKGDLVLLLVYVKAKFDNIPIDTLRKLKEAIGA
ncbi:transcriptional regulator [Variovorax ginsengisoli]|uniref:Transcriptional regulator n=1 Tax=Variovorax ginsengisoli TaxID=363844 RepID=A0ABT8S7K3_9BURK|nr:transcriptional regulator [Variovorax ginsengisoli]MDN8615729.1 transcriptional regulator [Variovorax ginsengisoli]MDO1534899.1 transcriptional regulator [Variovorax ginsengisoli]